MLKGPKALIAEGLTAVLDEFFEVDADAIEANLLGDTQVALRNTKLRPRTNELIKSDKQIVKSLTTGVVEEVLFTWDWVLFGQDYLVKNANLSVRGLRFKTQLSSTTIEEERQAGVERTESGRVIPERRSSLAEIKQEGLVEKYIRHQVEHIIDALTLSVEDFEFRLELPPNECGEVAGVSASGSSVSLMSVGGDLGGEERLKHRASFINGGLRQQLSFGSICFDIFKATETFPLLEPLSYQLSITRFTGQRFSGVASGLKAVGSPVYSSRHNIDDKDVVVHAGLTQIMVLIDLGNLILEKKRHELDENTPQGGLTMNFEEANLSLDKTNLDTLVEKDDDEDFEEAVEAYIDGRTSYYSPRKDDDNEEENDSNEGTVKDDIDGTVWYPSLSSEEEEESKEIEQDYRDDEKDDDFISDDDDDVYGTLKQDMKSSTLELPVSGVAVVLPNGARLTLEALRVNHRADGTVMNLEGEHGSGILIDGFQLVNTNSGYDGFAKSRWVVDLIASRFCIEEESCAENPPNYRAAQIRWTPRKLDLLLKGWGKIMECLDTRLNTEKQPGKCYLRLRRLPRLCSSVLVCPHFSLLLRIDMEFGGAICSGFSVSFGNGMN